MLALGLGSIGQFFLLRVLCLGTHLDMAEKGEFSKHGCQYFLRLNAIFRYI